jgi:mRNA interferase HicA
MNRARLIAHLTKHSCFLLREGAKHSVFRNLKSGVQVSVPRHRNILETTAYQICKQLGIPILKK